MLGSLGTMHNCIVSYTLWTIPGWANVGDPLSNKDLEVLKYGKGGACYYPHRLFLPAIHARVTAIAMDSLHLDLSREVNGSQVRLAATFVKVRNSQCSFSLLHVCAGRVRERDMKPIN